MNFDEQKRILRKLQEEYNKNITVIGLDGDCDESCYINLKNLVIFAFNTGKSHLISSYTPVNLLSSTELNASSLSTYLSINSIINSGSSTPLNPNTSILKGLGLSDTYFILSPSTNRGYFLSNFLNLSKSL